MTEAKHADELLLPGFERRSLDVHATRIAYQVGDPAERAGADSRPPLVLVHGFAGAGVNFSLLAPALARTHRVVVPDLPGHGASAGLPAVPSLAGFADGIAAVVEHEGTVPVVVVGHSMGGVVALRLAARRPELVRGVVLAAAAGISTTTRVAEAFLATTSVLRPGRRLAHARRWIARSPRLKALTFDGLSTSDGAALAEPAALGFLAASGLHTDLVGPARALAREDVRRDLELVRCPALVLWGARDRQVPIDDALEYARRLRAPLRAIPDCGHLLVGERPDACRDAIERFAMSV